MISLAAWERRIRGSVFRPAPRLSLSEWCDKYRVLSKIEGAEEGRWRTDRAPYQREIMDCMSDPGVERVVWMKPTQVGATVCMTNLPLYHMHQDPAQVMMVQPSEDLALKWSTMRFSAAVEATPVLQGMIKESDAGGARHSNNTKTLKAYPGGYITIAWASSDSKMRSLPVRVVLLDEVDGYEATKEGDPIKRAEKRTDTFEGRKKIILASTPTIKGHSRIEKEFDRSDQRRFHVACPDCGHEQTLKWSNLHYTGEDLESSPETARYACEECGSLWENSQKASLLASGRWIATHPGRAVVGFHLNALYSPWLPWSKLVREWLEAQGDVEKLQVFVNTILGESWEDRTQAGPGGLLERREDWGESGTIPMPVGIITAWSDVQADRIETLVMGHGGERGDEWFPIEARTFTGNTGKRPGDTQLPAVWLELEAFRRMPRTHASGAPIRFSAFLVDCGYNQDEVFRYTKSRQGQKVAATRGKGKKPPKTPLVSRRAQRNNPFKAMEWHVNTDEGKDKVFAKLRIQTPGPGYIHLPAWFEEEDIRQLTSESKVRKKVGGDYKLVWKKNYDRNERLDQFVGNLVASQPNICGLGREQIARRVAKFAAMTPADTEKTPVSDQEVETEMEPPPRAPRRARPRNGWTNNWRT